MEFLYQIQIIDIFIHEGNKMKNIILILSGFILFGCTSPVSVENIDNDSLNTLSQTTETSFKLLNHSTQDKGIANLNFEDNDGYIFHNFEGELNFDDTKMTLTNVSTTIPTQHGIFVWNDDLISGNYTRRGLRRVKFAYADSDPIGIAGTANLVKFEFDVNETSEICIINFLYGPGNIINELCETISLQSNPITFTINGK